LEKGMFNAKRISKELTILAQFEERYIPEPNSGCWLWLPSHISSIGYGAMVYKGIRKSAHRLSYELFVGDIPAGAVIMHICDNPACVNPAHLRCGSQAENMADKVRKGRQAKGAALSAVHLALNNKGENNNYAKLTDDLVREIRKNNKSAREWARELGLDKKTISLARKRITWRNVE